MESWGGREEVAGEEGEAGVVARQRRWRWGDAVLLDGRGELLRAARLT